MISKSVFDPIIAEWGKRNRGMMYTVEVNKEELSALPSSFLPSMVQEKLEKSMSYAFLSKWKDVSNGYLFAKGQPNSVGFSQL